MAAKPFNRYRQYVSVYILKYIYAKTQFFNQTVLFPQFFCSEMKISKEDQMNVVKKLCEPILKLPPTEIPALAYQIFSLCTTAALIVIPLYAFNQYFQRHFYKKNYQDMESDQSACGSVGKHIVRSETATNCILFYLNHRYFPGKRDLRGTRHSAVSSGQLFGILHQRKGYNYILSGEFRLKSK